MSNYYTDYSSMTTTERINFQEAKGRFLCQTSMTDFFTTKVTLNEGYSFTQTPIKDSVDVVFNYTSSNKTENTTTTASYGIEIKERNVTDESFSKYQNVALKIDKLDRIRYYQKANNLERVFYIVFFQQQKKAYIFNLDRLDFDVSIHHHNRDGIRYSVIYGNKKTQMSDNSATVNEEIYQIPLSAASKVIDCENQYKLWEEYGRNK